jgi:hypothetical protein
MDRTELQRIKELWQEQPDRWLLKALKETKWSYPQEIQLVILEVAEEKGLITKEEAEFQKGVIEKAATSPKIIDRSQEPEFFQNHRKIQEAFPELFKEAKETK